MTVSQREKPTVRPSVYIARHTLVVLMDDHLTPEKLAQPHERSIFQKSDAVARDGQIAQIVSACHQLAEYLRISANETYQFARVSLAYLVHPPRSGEVDKIHLKGLIEDGTFADVLAYHG